MGSSSVKDISGVPTRPPPQPPPMSAAISGFSSLPSVMTWKMRSSRYSAAMGRTLPFSAAKAWTPTSVSIDTRRTR